MFNLPLAVDVLARIEESREHPEIGEWNQMHWGRLNLKEVPQDRFGLDLIMDQRSGKIIGLGSCGTAKCFAGWALTLSDVKLVWERSGEDMYYAETTIDGEEVPETAWAVLGIVPPADRGDGDGEDPLWDYIDDMPCLFDGDNTLSDLYEIVAAHAQLTVSELRELVSRRVAEHRLAGKV